MFSDNPTYGTSQQIFLKIGVIPVALIWPGRPSRIALTTLQLPTNRAGLALPNMQFYCLASLIVTISWWFTLPS